jgi:hypothetical protein
MNVMVFDHEGAGQALCACRLAAEQVASAVPLAVEATVLCSLNRTDKQQGRKKTRSIAWFVWAVGWSLDG